MKNKTLIICAFLFSSCGRTSAQAQEAITASGGNATGNTGTVSYSVGQVVYTANTGTTGSVVPGVQQPYEIYSVGIDEPGGQITLTVYPNPAKDFLILKVENQDYENLSFRLYDIKGETLENKKIAGNETWIDMSNLLPAIYFLKITDNSKEVKTFKIIKN